MDYVVATLLDRVKWVNSTLREEVAGLTTAQLDYLPAPETNSLAVLVTHPLFGHAREHLAHVQLTKQLRPDRYPPVARPWI